MIEVLKAKLLNIIPVAVYMNKAYTQNIEIELSNGQLLCVDDSSKICRTSNINNTCNFEIFISGNKIEKQTVQKIKNIYPKRSYGPCADIYGQIVNIVINNEFVIGVIDTGIGKLKLLLNEKEQKQLDKGVFIYIENAHLTLRGYENVEN